MLFLLPLSYILFLYVFTDYFLYFRNTKISLKRRVVSISTSILLDVIVLFITIVFSVTGNREIPNMFIIFFVVSLALTLLNIKTYIKTKRYLIYIEEIKQKINKELEISITEFYDGYVNRRVSIKGVYVIRNKTKNKYYVGQSQNIVLRVRKHLEGSGNGHLFADYKYGDLFSVILIRFNPNKYTSLSHQERAYIEIFDSFNRGYNKTRGGS